MQETINLFYWCCIMVPHIMLAYTLKGMLVCLDAAEDYDGWLLVDPWRFSLTDKVYAKAYDFVLLNSKLHTL